MTRKKAVWKYPEISKVRLNPEQAVLSCCDAMTGRGLATITAQCDFFRGTTCCTDDFVNAVSS